MNDHQIKVLQALTEISAPEKKITIHFSRLAVQLDLTKSDLDKALNDLENNRYIDQYGIDGNDEMLIVTKEKAFTSLH